MADKKPPIPISGKTQRGGPGQQVSEDLGVGRLRKDYAEQQNLFNAQPALTQRFLEAQARQLADAIVQRLPQAKFTLPNKVVVEVTGSGAGPAVNVPQEFREQMAGGLIDRLTRTDLRMAVRTRLLELEQVSEPAVAASADLIRFTTAFHMVHNLLPSGRSVEYRTVDGEEIPSIPVASQMEPGSAITAPTDAIAEEERGEAGRGELLVPYVEAARRFYLPQWVAFDDQGNLLVKSVNEAEAHLASMQRFLEILHTAVSLAPYMVADEDYQRKRYGMLGQIVNQGRALAWYETEEIIKTIKHRASANDLNRGLSISLPYFDDQDLLMKTHGFEIIPAGRIMFVPAFVVRAAREEHGKVAQDTRMSPSTRKYLLAELDALDTAFDSYRE